MSPELYVLLGVLFVAVAGVVYSVAAMFLRGPDARKRLRGVVGRAELSTEDVAEWQARVIKAAGPVARLATPTSDADISRVRAKFLYAGFRDPSAPVAYFALKAVLAILLPVLLLLFTEIRTRPGYQPMFVMLLVAAIGYYLPNVVLARLTANRQRELFEAFPDALDMIIVCVE